MGEFLSKNFDAKQKFTGRKYQFPDKRKTFGLSHLETYTTVGACDDDQLAVKPLLAQVDPHRQLLAQPEGGHHEGHVDRGRGAEGEEGGQHPDCVGGQGN